MNSLQSLPREVLGEKTICFIHSIKKGAVRVGLMVISVTFANLSVFELFIKQGMSVSEVLCHIRRVPSFRLHSSVACFTHRLKCVFWLALTIGEVSEMVPYFASPVLLVNKPGTVGRSFRACRHFYRLRSSLSHC